MKKGLTYGYLTNMKIDNMRMQHEAKAAEAQREKAEASQEAFPYMAVDPTREVGFVAVCAGQGLAELFKELGVDAIVSGGQTMNPSTDDILAAIHSVGAKNVFVLPNNKNIIMAAEQAVKLADRKVTVIQTRHHPPRAGGYAEF